MTIEERGQFSGLMTSIAETLAPASALRIADNVVIRRFGALEPRTGFIPFDPPWSAAPYLRSAPVAGAQIYETEFEWISSESGLVIIVLILPNSFTSAIGRFRPDAFSHALARGNLYICSAYGIAKATDASGSNMTVAGIKQGAVVAVPVNINANVNGALPNNSHVSYRIVFRKIDANGMEYVGPPTGAIEVTNTSGATVAPLLNINIYDLVGPLDTIEIYRTRVFPNSVALDDEHLLVAKLGYSDAIFHLTNLSVYDYIDLIQDAQRGATLYTSPSQEGIENENSAPPAAAFVELHKGVLFFGNIRGPSRFTLSYKFTGARQFETPSYIATDGGIGIRQFTGNVTNGSTTFTITSATTGLRVGQAITSVNGSSSVPYPYIVAISGSTITASVAMPFGTASGASIFTTDAIVVNGLAFPCDYGGEGVASAITASNSLGICANTVTPPSPGATATVVIESVLRTANEFTVYASHGDEYLPAVSFDINNPDRSKQDEYPNGLMWSKPDQPESVPPANYSLLGEKSRAILGLESTRDALFILKEDGILRLAGVYGAWQIDPFDLTTFCVLPSSVAKLDGRIYALTNKGVVAIDDSGVQIISEPIHDQVALLVDDCINNFRTLGYYKISGVDGVAATVDARNSEYILLTGDVPLSFGGDALIFNARTGSWTTASFNPGSSTPNDFAGFVPSGLGVSWHGDPLILHFAGVRFPNNEQTLLDNERSVYMHDGSTTSGMVSHSLISQTQARYDCFPAVVCIPGDILELDDGTQLRIASMVSPGSVIVDLVVPGALPPTTALTFYRGLRCSLQPHGYAQTRPVNKLWTRVFWTFARFLGPVHVEATYSSAGPLQDDATQEAAGVELPAFAAPSGFSEHHSGILMQGIVPRAHARSWLIRPRLTWSAAKGRVSLETVGIESRENASNRSLIASGSTS